MVFVSCLFACADTSGFADETPPPTCEGPNGVTYSESLATVLRGVLIGKDEAELLGIPDGYYRMGEYRCWEDTSLEATSVEITTSFGECATETGSRTPAEHDEFVFSIFHEWEYDADGTSASLEDTHGHELVYEIWFEQTCKEVSLASLDGVAVRMSTQNHGTSALDTCGWVGEPEFTIPPVDCS